MDKIIFYLYFEQLFGNGLEWSLTMQIRSAPYLVDLVDPVTRRIWCFYQFHWDLLDENKNGFLHWHFLHVLLC